MKIKNIKIDNVDLDEIVLDRPLSAYSKVLFFVISDYESSIELNNKELKINYQHGHENAVELDFVKRVSTFAFDEAIQYLINQYRNYNYPQL